MNIIYDAVNELFTSQENSENNLNEIELFLKSENLIIEALKEKDDLLLNEAIEEANTNNEPIIKEQLVSSILKSINTITYSTEDGEYVSFLVLIPYLIISNNEELFLPPLQLIEYWWKEILVNNQLIPSEDSFNLSPVILSEKAISKMTHSSWYHLHAGHCEFLDKRDKRPMYTNQFKVDIEKDTAHLKFLVGSIQVKKDIIYDTPILFNGSVTVAESIENSLNIARSTHKSMIPDTDWVFVGIGHTYDMLPLGYEAYQSILLSNFIKAYVNKPPITFGLIPIDNEAGFSLIAWNENKNLVIDAILLYPFIKDLGQIVETITQTLAIYNIAEFAMGDEPIDSTEFNNLGKFDFAFYMRKKGVSFLQIA